MVVHGCFIYGLQHEDEHDADQMEAKEIGILEISAILTPISQKKDT